MSEVRSLFRTARHRTSERIQSAATSIATVFSVEMPNSHSGLAIVLFQSAVHMAHSRMDGMRSLSTCIAGIKLPLSSLRTTLR